MNAKISQCVTELQSSDSAVRAAAAERLCLLESEAQAAAVDLARAVVDPSEEVVEFAVAALESVGPPRAADVDELIGLLGNGEPDVAYWAATLLGRLGGEAATAATALASAAENHAADHVRQRAAWAVKKIKG